MHMRQTLGTRASAACMVASMEAAYHFKVTYLSELELVLSVQVLSDVKG